MRPWWNSKADVLTISPKEADQMGVRNLGELQSRKRIICWVLIFMLGTKIMIPLILRLDFAWVLTLCWNISTKITTNTLTVFSRPLSEWNGVDKSDQFRVHYGIKSTKLWKYIFWFLLDVSAVNAYVVPWCPGWTMAKMYFSPWPATRGGQRVDRRIHQPWKKNWNRSFPNHTK